jgi:hypothetical protein
MPRESKVIEVPEREIEPEGAQETQKEEIDDVDKVKPEVKPEFKPKVPKRILTEKQLENLKRAREAALLKQKEIKELA